MVSHMWPSPYNPTWWYSVDRKFHADDEKPEEKPKNLELLLEFEPMYPKNVLLASVVHGIFCLFKHNLSSCYQNGTCESSFERSQHQECFVYWIHGHPWPTWFFKILKLNFHKSKAQKLKFWKQNVAIFDVFLSSKNVSFWKKNTRMYKKQKGNKICWSIGVSFVMRRRVWFFYFLFVVK
jgi:hypothetical protein